MTIHSNSAPVHGINSIAVYAGSFDPVTWGHLWMIEQGARLFGRLKVAVAVNPSKACTFSVEERKDLVRASLEHIQGAGRIEVDAFEDRYLVEYAKDQGAAFLLRGIRGAGDADYERMLRHVNADMAPDVLSVFLMPPRELGEVSSSLVRGLVGPAGWRDVVARMVTPPVLNALERLAEARDV